MINNGSTDGGEQLLSKYSVHLMSEARPGACAALRSGAAAAKGEILALTHADCVAEVSWLRELVSAFEDPDVGACGGGVTFTAASTSVERFLQKNAASLQRGNVLYGDSPLPWVNFVNAGIRTSALQASGGFDLAFAQECELDVSWRLLITGYQLVAKPQAGVLHSLRSSVPALWKRFVYIGRAAPKFSKKYRSLYTAQYHDLSFLLRGVPKALWQCMCGHLHQLRYRDEETERYLHAIVFLALCWGAWWESAVAWCRIGEQRVQALQFSALYILIKGRATCYCTMCQSGQSYQVNEVGFEILSLYLKGHAANEIVELLHETYGSEVGIAELRADVLEVLQPLGLE